MKKLKIYDRSSKKYFYEDVYGENLLTFLYKKNAVSIFFLNLISKFSIFSSLYGFFNKLKISKYKIIPFIKRFNINTEEFEKKIKNFKSFNDFFIRKLNKDARKVNLDSNVLTLPCDGKFLAFERLNEINNFYIKGKRFDLFSFLKDKNLADKYKDGSMLLCRLSPYDNHRFHFPIDCTPNESKLINGFLFSVNPIALMQNLSILSENKRSLTILKTKDFKDILYIEIAATNVGSIKQSYFPNKDYKKAEEKGYFELGSSLVLLFEKDCIKFDLDLIQNTKNNIETKAFLGDGFAIKK
jgi:phosphatidylserine decarboxylase